MTKPYDATTRNLYAMNPAEWSAYLGHPVPDPGRVRLIDSNLSTIAAEVDRVIRLEDPIPWLWHIEFQAGRDLGLPVRSHFYSTLLHHHYQLPVRTTLILLREVAFGPELTGILEMRYPNGEIYDWFRYDVVKVWEQPVERILAAGLTVLPLAPVSQVETARVPGVLVAMSERFRRETTPDHAGKLWDATKFLMGLRYRTEEIDEFMRGVYDMLFGIRGIEQSSVYQDIFHKGEARGEARGRAKGALEEARDFLILLGRDKFGPPDDEAKAKIAALSDLDRLHKLGTRILEVASWEELLAGPPNGPG
jgi:hypothetical protein